MFSYKKYLVSEISAVNEWAGEGLMEIHCNMEENGVTVRADL